MGNPSKPAFLSDGAKSRKKQARTLSQLAGVMDELQTIIAAENDHLTRGLPATLLDTTARKDVLSREYGALGNDLVDGETGPVLDDQALQEKLLVVTSQLYAMTEQNRQLLNRALVATRRRVDKVMDAIRLHEAIEDRPEDTPPSGRTTG